MKLLFLTIILFGNIFISHAQWFNRAYANAAYGYKKHGEYGLYAHVFNHLSVGFNSGLTRVKVGPGAPKNGGLFTRYKYYKDEYSSKNFFIGVTTSTKGRFDASFMAGPSWINATKFSDFVKVENTYNDDFYSYSAKQTNSKTIGLVLRAEALFEISKIFGINLSVQQQLNSIRNDFSVVVGLNIGIVQDWSN